MAGAAGEPEAERARGALAAATAELLRRYDGEAGAVSPPGSDGPGEGIGDVIGDVRPIRIAPDGVPDSLPEGARILVGLGEEEGTPFLAVLHDPAWLREREGAAFGRRLLRLLEAALTAPDLPLEELDLLEPEERRLLLESWAGEPAPYPRDASVTSLLRAVARAHPDAVAVEEPHRRVSYRELLSRVASLRAALQRAGVVPGGRVGVYLDRSLEMVAALAAVLDAGCAYVPLDPEYPPLRLRGMAKVAELSAVLARPEAAREVEAFLETSERAVAVVAVAPDADPSHAEAAGGERPGWREHARQPDDEGEGSAGGGLRPAYVMFTSGSTGEPKGVEVPHRAVVRLVRGTDYVDLPPGERVLGWAPVAFDASTFEIWGPLLNGGTLVLAPTGLPSLEELAAYIEQRRISTLWLTSAVFEQMVEYHADRFGGVRQLLTGGDTVSPGHARRLLERHPALRLINGYGPTENTTFTACHTIHPGEVLDPSVPIGRPIRNSSVYILDGRGRLVPPGMAGELCTGGDGLALGYFNRPDLTAERFVHAPFLEGEAARLYRTGDLARHMPDGAIEFLGRVDDQLKIRGHRVEPGEVESVLREAPGVAAAAVVPRGSGRERWLRAVVVPASPGAGDPGSLREFLASRLPRFAIPAEFLFLETLPLTANGKTDRRALASMEAREAGAGTGEAPRRSDAEGRPALDVLHEIWSDLLGGRPFGPDDAFFDVGGDSLLTLRMVEELKRRAGIELPVVRVFEFPTLRTLARHLEVRDAEPGPAAPAHGGPTWGRADSGAVAVIGMAGRFPGAEDVAGLWKLLARGGDALTRFRSDELEVSPELARRTGYVPARGILEDVQSFDAEFFRMNPREAGVTDPQTRVLLESAWGAFEDAGRIPGEGPHLVGAFVGVSHNTYYERNLLAHPELIEDYGALRILFGNDKDYVSTVLAHKLDLRGPAVTVQTASSTSLTALALAVQAIRSGMCDMALAGGASVTVPVRSGHLYEEGAMLSRDGVTRTFDASASGTVFSDGAAMVLLRRLEDAVREGDPIHAVICGVGVTNDGAARASFSAPSVAGQALCVTRALEDAGWSADTVSYVEAHGTATPLGDPVEVEALTRAFAATTDRKRFCLIGSLKSNVGHLTAAAGVAGLIKTALAMRHRWIPPTLHFEVANPAIDFEASPFVVARKGVAWETEGRPRRAGVSSFGAGGTNVHVVLEEWSDEPGPAPEACPRLLPLSARSEAALRVQAGRLADALEHLGEPLGRVARTLQEGRKAFPVRGFVVARDGEEAVRRLRGLARADGPIDRAAPDSPGVSPVFLFPGQGTQFPGMASALHATFPAIRMRLEECSRLAGPVAGRDLLEWILGGGPGREETARALQDTGLAQPALFAVQYAVARTLMDWGIRPRAMVGHSIGELTAACLAGVMDLATAVAVVRERGRLMGSMPSGSMLSIRAAAESVEPLLGPDLAVAARNAPRLVVVSGPSTSIAELEARLGEAGIVHRRLRTSHAFHSPMMEDAAAAFGSFLAGVELRPPAIPFVACPFGRRVTADEATSPAYWARQLLEPVRFADGVVEVATLPGCYFVEIGPGATLATLVRQILGRDSGSGARVAAAMQAAEEGRGEEEALLAALGRLWSAGVETLDWAGIASGGPWRRVSLPGYPFERRRHWIDSAAVPLQPGQLHRRTTGSDGAREGAGDEGDEAGPDLASLIEDQRRIIQGQMRLLKRLGRTS